MFSRSEKRRSLASLLLLAGMLSLFFVAPLRAATISGFSPAFGQPGNVITINGSGLSSVTAVDFNNINSTPAGFTVISDDQLQAVVPLGATTGPLQVFVGATGVSSSSSFFVAPVISSFSPTAGTSPTMVTIQGANFIIGGTSVLFSGASQAVAGDVLATTEVTATLPTNAVTGPITVFTSAGTNASTTNFIISTLPSITAFSPAVGAINTNVIITGGNFFSPLTVYFYNNKVAAASVQAATQITATVPANAITGPITVSNVNGAVTTSSNFLVATGPVITGFSPTSGVANTPVFIDGYNLGPVTQVLFNGVAGTIVGAPPNLQVDVPSGARTGPIEVYVSSTVNFTTSSNFTISTGPSVTDFSPISGPAGTPVTINGENFSGTPAVKFGNVSATTVRLIASTQISADVPDGALVGSSPITVTENGSSFSTSTNFTVTGTGPVISDFSPSNGAPGTVVTINGGNFQDVTAVNFNGVSSASFSATATTEITATVPPTATTGPISVTASGFTGASSNSFYLQPWITSTSTNGAIVNSIFLINGRSLAGATQVQVNGISYKFSPDGAQLSATVPSNATTGAIEVTAPGGVFISTNNFAILPKIYSFSPNIGPAGTVVTIKGTSLFDVTNVQFGTNLPSAGAAVFNVATNQLETTVPAGALTGQITVLSPYGNDVSTNTFLATKASFLTLSEIATPAFAQPGTNVAFTVQVTNEGPSIVTGVFVTNTILGNFSYVSSSGSQGSGAYSNGTLLWNFGLLTNNTGATFEILGSSADTGIVTNESHLGFNEGNLNGGFNDNFAYAFAYFFTPAQRTLSVSFLDHPPELFITWPISDVHFQLQVSTNLTSSNAWQSPEFSAFVTNGVNAYTDRFDLPESFYRLQAP